MIDVMAITLDELCERVAELLAAADRLGLKDTAIHLNQALVTLDGVGRFPPD